LKKDLGIFIIIASKGAYSIIAMITVVVCAGLYSFSNTKF